MTALLTLQAVNGTAGGPAGGGIALAANIALIILGVLALVSIVVLLRLLMQIRAVGLALRDVSRSVEKKAEPLLERAQGIAANVEFISAAVRTDVEQLNQSVKALSARLQQASDHMETRIDEFNALMEVVQGEAEGVFLDTASTVRGIRAGARRLANPEDGENPDDGPSSNARPPASPAGDPLRPPALDRGGGEPPDQETGHPARPTGSD